MFVCFLANRSYPKARIQGARHLHSYNLTAKVRAKFYPPFIDGESGVQINWLAEDCKEVSAGARMSVQSV